MISSTNSKISHNRKGVTIVNLVIIVNRVKSLPQSTKKNKNEWFGKSNRLDSMLSELYSSFLGVIFFKEDNYP